MPTIHKVSRISRKERILAFFLAIVLAVSAGITIQHFQPTPIQAVDPRPDSTGTNKVTINLALTDFSGHPNIDTIFSYDTGVITILKNPDDSYIELTGDATGNNYTVAVNPTVPNTPVYIVLNNVTITSSMKAPITIGADANVTLDLEKKTENIVKNTDTSPGNGKSAIQVNGGELKIVGAQPGGGEDWGILEAKSGGYSAGIGGSNPNFQSDKEFTVTIESGDVRATGGTGAAGIGGGRQQSAGATVTINGGTVTATGGSGGAGIGGGREQAKDATVTINGGTVKATGGFGAPGIGGGREQTKDATVTIKNGANVTAFAGSDNTNAVGRGTGTGGTVTLTIGNEAKVVGFANGTVAPIMEDASRPLVNAKKLPATLPATLAGKQLAVWKGETELNKFTIPDTYTNFANVAFTTGGEDEAVLLEVYTPAGGGNDEKFHGWLTLKSDITEEIKANDFSATDNLTLDLTNGFVGELTDAAATSDIEATVEGVITPNVVPAPQYHPGLTPQLGYQVKGATPLDPKYTAKLVVDPATGAFTQDLTGLTGATTYETFLSATNGRGDGNFKRRKDLDPPLEFKTKDAPFKAILNPDGGAWSDTFKEIVGGTTPLQGAAFDGDNLVLTAAADGKVTNPVNPDRMNGSTPDPDLKAPANKVFGGWWYDVDNGVTLVPTEWKYNTEITLAKDIEVKAKWLDEIKVTFKPEGGTWGATNSAGFTPPNPLDGPLTATIRGRTTLVKNPRSVAADLVGPTATPVFAGWWYTVTNPNDTEWIPGTTGKEIPVADRVYEFTLTAKWEAASADVTVNFDPAGGTWGDLSGTDFVTPNPPTDPLSKTVDRNTLMSNPVTLDAHLTKDEFRFAGWFTDLGTADEAEVTFPLNTTETPEILDVTAKWHSTSADVEVTFDLNGGDWAVGVTAPPNNKVKANRNIAGGSEGNLENPGDLELGGHRFLGWFATKDPVDGETAWDFRATATLDPIGKEMTLYGRFVPQVTVNFDPNDGSGLSPVSQTVDVGGKLAAPTITPPGGKTLKGWFTAVTGGTQWDFATMTVTATNPGTLHAQWNDIPNPPTSVTVTFVANGGTGLTPTSQTVDVGEKLMAPTITPPAAGQELKGWFTTATGSTQWDFATMTVTATSPRTLHAQWEWTNAPNPPQEVTVQFNLNGGSGSAPQPQTVVVGEKLTKPNPDPTRTQFRFVGWFDIADATRGTGWNFDTAVSATTPTTLYARWAPESVKFISLDGTTVHIQKATDGSGRLQKPADPTPRDHRRFTGWFTKPMAEENTPTVMGEGVVLGITDLRDENAAWDFEHDIAFEGLQLYAHDEWIMHNVQFSANGGTWNDNTIGDKNRSVRDGSTVVAPGTVTRQNHTFLGWYVVGGGEWNPNTPITANTRIYAAWRDNGISIPPNSNPNPWTPWPPSSQPPAVSNPSSTPSSTPSSKPSSSKPSSTPSSSTSGTSKPGSGSVSSDSGKVLPDNSNRNGGSGGAAGNTSSRISKETPKTGDSTLPMMILLLTGLFGTAGVVTFRLRRKSEQNGEG